MGKMNRPNVQNNKGGGNKEALKGISAKPKNITKTFEDKQQKKPFANGEQNKKKFLIQTQQENVVKKEKQEFTNGAGKKANREEKKKGNNESKEKDTNAGISKKKKVKTPQVKVNEDVENNLVLKLDKRNKTRLKCELKKEMIMKGKNPAVVLNKKSLLKNKLKKLVGKPEPHSKKVQKKIMLIEMLLSKLKDAKGADKETGEEKTTAANEVKKPKKKKNKSKEKNPEAETTEEVEKDGEKLEGKNFPRDQFVVFIGNLPVTITKESLLEAFKEVKGINKVRLPRKRAQKTRRFAYIQVENEEARLNLLKMHGTLIEGKPVNIFYADRKKGKSVTAQNAQLIAQRRLAQVTEADIKEIGKKLQSQNKDKKNKNMKVKKEEQVEEEDDDEDDNNSESD